MQLHLGLPDHAFSVLVDADDSENLASVLERAVCPGCSFVGRRHVVGRHDSYLHGVRLDPSKSLRELGIGGDASAIILR